MNNFPHAYLTNKQTLPLCLVHIFTAIATRLGLNASPINFPGTVLAHVLPRHEGAEPVIVNPSVSQVADPILNSPFSHQSLHMATHLPGLSMDVSTTSQSLQPCTGLLMLIRASRNILSLMSIYDVPPSILRPALLLSICVHFLLQAEDETLDRLLSNVRLQAWDCILLLDCLAPSLIARCRAMVRFRCQTVLDAEAAAELNIHRRTGKLVRYFVGMAFVHASYNCVGFIYGWDVSTSHWVFLL
jgi:F-box protein 21